MAFFSYTLQSSNQIISTGDVIGVLSYAASNEASNGDSRLISGSIESVAESNFTAVANPASLVFSTSTSADAVEQMRLTSVGYLGINTSAPSSHLHVAGNAQVDKLAVGGGGAGDSPITIRASTIGGAMVEGSTFPGYMITDTTGGNDILYGILGNATGQLLINADFSSRGNDSGVGIAVRSTTHLEITSGGVKVSNAYTLPTSDGSAGQIIKTDGAGVLTWEDAPSGGGGGDIDGSGAANSVAVWSDTNTLTTGIIQDNSNAVSINREAGPTSRKLTVAGGTGDNSAAVLIQASGHNATGSDGLLLSHSNTGDAYIWNFENRPMVFATNNAEGMRLSNDLSFTHQGSAATLGNASTYKLTVSSTDTKIGGDRFILNASEVVLNNNADNFDFRVKGDTDQYLFIADASADRVGIGTSTPSNKLTVIGDASFGAFERTPNNVNATSFYDRIEIGGGTQATKNYGHVLVYNTSNIATHWFNSFAGANNYINNGGNLGIGTSTPAHKLDVRYTAGEWGLKVAEAGDSTDGILIGDAQFDNRFQGIGHASYVDSDDYIIATSGTDTYISARTGEDVLIRGGGNVGTYQIRVANNQCSMGNGLLQIVGGETRFNPANADQDVTFEGVSDTQLLAVDAGLNKVGIGTNPTAGNHSKFTVDGGISNLYGWTTLANIGNTTGQGVDEGFYLTLTEADGTTLQSHSHYFVQMTTLSTSTRSGGSYLAYYESSNAKWYVRPVGQSNDISNSPLLTEVSGQLRAYTDNVTGYPIRYNVSTYYTQEADSRPHSMGANYHWQRLVDDLYYNDGNVAINSGNLTVGIESAALQGGDQGIHIHAGTTSEIKLTNDATGSLTTDGSVIAITSDDLIIRNRELAGNVYLTTGPGSSAIVADSSQRVGVNTTPSYRFHSKDGSGELFHSSFGTYARATGGNKPFFCVTNASGLYAMSTDENHEFKLWKGNIGATNNDILTVTNTGLIKQLNTIYNGTPTELNDIFNKFQFYNDGSVAGGFGMSTGAINIGSTGAGVSTKIYGASGIASVVDANNNTTFLKSGGDTYAFFDYEDGLLNFGTGIDAAATANKIKLYDGGLSYAGFGVSTGQMDITTSSTISQNYYVGGVKAMQINNGGVVINPDSDNNKTLRVMGDTDTSLIHTDPATDRVGIGYSLPEEKLHVLGNIKSRNGTDSRFILEAGTNQLVSRATTAGQYNFIGSTSEHPVSLGVGDNEFQLVLGNTNANYNVSIGANPVNNAAFQVYKAAPATGPTSYFNTYKYTTVPSGDVTALRGIQVDARLQDGADLANYYAITTGSLTGDGNVDTAIGLYLNNSSMTGSVTNYGVYSDIASGDSVGTYGLFMAGTAPNHMTRGMSVDEVTGSIGSDHKIERIENCHFSSNLQNDSGYMKIRLPARADGVKWTNTMVMFDVEIYDYRSLDLGAGKKFTFGGYNYTTGTWINCTASLVYYDRDNDNDNPWLAKFCQDPDGYPCVLIYRRDDEELSDWDYPQVVVSNVRTGFSNFRYDQWSKGWEISLEKSDDLGASGYINTSTVDITAPLTNNQTKYDFYCGGTGRNIDHTNHVVFGSAANIFNLGQNNIDFRVAGDADYDMLFGDASTDRIGIGTSVPTGKLHVETKSSEDSIVIGRGSNRSSIRAYGGADTKDQYLALDSNGQNLLLNHFASDDVQMVVGGGKVVIGNNSNPSSKLQVSAVSNASFYLFNLEDDTPVAADVGGGMVFRGKYAAGGNKARLGGIKAGKTNDIDGNYEGYLKFEASNGSSLAEVARITSSGNMGIGTTHPQAELQVSSNNPSIIIGTDSNVPSSVCSLKFQDRANASNQDSEGQITAYLNAERNGSSAEYDMVFGVIDVNDTANDAVEKMRLTGNGSLNVTKDINLTGTLKNVTNASTVEWLESTTNSSQTKRVTTGTNPATFWEGIDNQRWRIASDQGGYYPLFDVNYNTGNVTVHDRLGVGVDAPTYKMEVAGHIMSSGDGISHIALNSNQSVWCSMLAGATEAAIGTVTSSNLHIRTGNINRISISSAGNVTINENGYNCDFRVEGDTDTDLFRTDASADTVQVGSSVSASNAKLYVYSNPTNIGTAGMSAVYGRVESTTTANGTNYDMGLRSRVEKSVASGVVDTGYGLGANIVALMNGPGTLTELTCVRANGGTYYGAANGGTVSNYYGFRHIPIDVTGGDSSITVGYGMYLAALPDNTVSRYGVFQLGANDSNRFAGTMTVGATSGPRSGYQLTTYGHISSENTDAKIVAIDDSTIFTKLQSSVSNNFGLVGTESNHHFNFRTNNVDRGRFLNTGEFQLGTANASPEGLLDCRGTAYFEVENSFESLRFKNVPAFAPYALRDVQELKIHAEDETIYLMHSENTVQDGSTNVQEKNAIRMNTDSISFNAPPAFVFPSTQHYPKFEVNTSTGAATFNDSFTFPTTDGAKDQVLATDGNGQVSWQDGGGSGTSSLSLKSITITNKITSGGIEQVNFTTGTAGSPIAVPWAEMSWGSTSVFTFDESANNTRVTIEEDGVYSIKSVINFVSAGANRAMAASMLRISGTLYTQTRGFAYTRGASYGNSGTMYPAITMPLSSGDYIEVVAYDHDSDQASALTTIESLLEITKVGSTLAT